MNNLECNQQIGKPNTSAIKQTKKQQSEKLDFNNFTLLKDPKQFALKLQQLNELGLEKIRAQQNQDSVQILGKAEQMLILAKNTNKHITHQLKICIYYNLACAYQGIWNLQKCNKFCQTVSDEIEYIIKTVEFQNKQKIIKYNIQLLKLKLQHCAILSQLGQHKKAYEMSKLTLNILKQSLYMLLDFTKTFKTYKIEENNYRDKIQFSISANKYIELIKDLITDIQQQIQTKKIKQKPFFYFWKNNPENNEKHIKKEFENKKKFSREEEARTILGVQNQNAWIQQFNIGTIMHMSPITEKQLLHIPSFFQELTRKNLYQKIIFSSVLHFTIATQIRFIQIQLQKQKEIKNKYATQVKSQAYIISESYHLKAIEIICKGISTCSPYLNHLISSYHKHYVQSLRSIDQHEQSLISQLNSTKKGNIIDELKRTQSNHNQDYYNNSKIKNLTISQESINHKNLQINSNIKQQYQTEKLKIERIKKQQSHDKIVKKQKRKSEPFLPNQQLSKISIHQKINKSSSRNKSKKIKINNMKSKTPQSKLILIKDLNLIKCKTNSKNANRLPLNIIKKAFHHKSFKDLLPKQITINQKTSTSINLILKKKNTKS